MWSARGQEFGSPQPPYTVYDIVQAYIRAEKPLDGLLLFHLLEPLAGTSFLTTATQGLRLHIAEKRFESEKRLYPNDLFRVFYGPDYHEQVERVQDGTRLDEATIALHSLSTHAIGLDQIKTLPWLEEDEMMLRQARSDFIYHDRTRTQSAFTHIASQWQFYKRGSHLLTIPESRISYQDEAGTYYKHAIMPDGFQDSRFFLDGRQRAYIALPLEQQEFKKGHRMLFISPRFSFDAARRK